MLVFVLPCHRGVGGWRMGEGREQVPSACRATGATQRWKRRCPTHIPKDPKPQTSGTVQGQPSNRRGNDQTQRDSNQSPLARWGLRPLADGLHLPSQPSASKARLGSLLLHGGKGGAQRSREGKRLALVLSLCSLEQPFQEQPPELPAFLLGMGWAALPASQASTSAVALAEPLRCLAPVVPGSGGTLPSRGPGSRIGTDFSAWEALSPRRPSHYLTDVHLDAVPHAPDPCWSWLAAVHLHPSHLPSRVHLQRGIT